MLKALPTIAAFLMLLTTVFGAEPNKPELGAKRAAILKANVKDFQLGLSYFGSSGKPYYELLLSVPKENIKQSDAFFLVSQLSEDQALKIIAHLADSGALDRAVENDAAVKLQDPTYRLKVSAGELRLSESLGFDLDLLKRLDGLRSVLDGNPAKDMDFLLGRLSGHRKVWEAAAK
jgi:hypothetical protein